MGVKRKKTSNRNKHGTAVEHGGPTQQGNKAFGHQCSDRAGCCSGTGPVSAEPFVSMTMELPGALRVGKMGGRTGRNDETGNPITSCTVACSTSVSAGRAGLDVEKMRRGKRKKRVEENSDKREEVCVVNEKGNKQPERNRSEKLEWEIEGTRLPKALLGDLPVGARRRSGKVHPLPVAWYFKKEM
ncbi:hypothetical protein BO83DRAFT_403290 [Aspergillus eucalypticola CBS 122712]|uniref:Uncharacterized protein n=1 Tax=Aspergillus eucalypticola (strain CBS 122712 / IBT 29274) TaxID=1448314 RepID=A0A317UPP7_ASPEC|nr:uncharacterized protein BO83DRAFT_403290 [Aspergillus eucalypticola CBS 122712]PWY63186.1 hypothetical protein BO83DRAFT_403290 [Aspergillus eucalypticola CBS 122712]